MKLLNDDKYALLMGQASAFVAIQTALVEASDDMSAEDITSDMVIEALQNNDHASQMSDDLAATQAKLDIATEQLTDSQTALEAANARIEELEAEMRELDLTPATPPASLTPKSDAGENTDTLAEFANKNKGNTQAIIAQAQKEGLI